MRPWLLLPILLPALWAGITFADMWPEGGPGWLASPMFAVAVTLCGIALAMLADNLARRPTRIGGPSWLTRIKVDVDRDDEDAGATWEEPVYEEPLVKVETPLAQAWRTTREHFQLPLQVDMPDRRTATPAPRG